MSQLGLANAADISSRHLCFLETGRARPSREMVQHLARELDIPLSEQNALLIAAGYAPIYGQRELAAPELAPVRQALDFILLQQEPYPAIVMDGQWNIVMQNQATARIFGLFQTPVKTGEVENAMRSVFHPDGLRKCLVNWEELAGQLMQTLHREAADGTNVAVARLRDELLTYPGVLTLWKIPDPTILVPPLLTLRLKKDDTSLAFFSTMTTFAAPRDITLQQLRIECFYPADAATAAMARRLAVS